MFALFTFGPVLEHTLRSKEFITFYIITGLGAAVLYAGLQYVEVSRLETLYQTYLVQPDPKRFVDYLKHFPRNTYNACYSLISIFLISLII